MRAPVEFLVTRQLLTESQAGPAEISRRCHLRASSVARAYHKVREITDLHDHRLFRHLLELKERPHWSNLHFYMPDPRQWQNRYKGSRWLSGEVAAALEGYNLVPERWLVYLLPDDLDEAVEAAKTEYAKVAPPGKANLTFRNTDPWMDLPTDSDLIQRGQRLLDYWASRHVQLTAELMHD